MALQEGIAWRSAREVRRNFALVTLRREPGADRAAVVAALTSVWRSYADLRLIGQSGGLHVLIAYGARLFHGTSAAAELRECGFDQGRPGQPVVAGSALRYAPDVVDNRADADVAIQLTVDDYSVLARALVATDQTLRLRASQSLRICGAWTGFARSDRRGWMGFHDSVANLDTRERLNAILVGAQADDHWLRNGTYLAFLRLTVNLDYWVSLSIQQRELLVGRAAATGVPLQPSANGPVGAPLAPGTTDVLDPPNTALRDPLPISRSHPSALGLSHIHRARRHPNLRLLRRGYEFLDVSESGQVRPGLNFVSFQSTPMRIATILRSPGWFGEVDFGGAAAGDMPPLLAVRAAGLFAVPPAELEGPPGLQALEFANWD